MERRRTDLRNAVKASEQNAFQMLVSLFDWLDGLEPQPMTMAKGEKYLPVSSSTCLHLFWRSSLILAVNQEPPSNHTDKSTLLQRIGKFLTRTGEIEKSLEETLGPVKRKRRRKSEIFLGKQKQVK